MTEIFSNKFGDRSGRDTTSDEASRHEGKANYRVRRVTTLFEVLAWDGWVPLPSLRGKNTKSY
jgi:hypothetical protein